MLKRIVLPAACLVLLAGSVHAFIGGTAKGTGGLYFKSGYYHLDGVPSPSATYYQFSLSSGSMGWPDLLDMEWGILNFTQINGTAGSPLDMFDRAIAPGAAGMYIKYPSMSLTFRLFGLVYFGVDYAYNIRTMLRNDSSGGLEFLYPGVTVGDVDYGNEKTPFKGWIYGLSLPLSGGLGLHVEGLYHPAVKMYSSTDGAEHNVGGWGIMFYLLAGEPSGSDE